MVSATELKEAQAKKLVKASARARKLKAEDPFGYAPKKFKRATGSTQVTKRAERNMKHAKWRIETDTNIAWGNALDCPLFKKPRIGGKDPKTGKPKPIAPDRYGNLRTTRPNRALGSHTVKALLSGAAAAVAAQQHYDAVLLRSDIGTKGKNEAHTETNTYPMLGTITPGALMHFDQQVIAFCQEAFNNAKDIKNALGIHKKVTRRSAQAGLDIVTRKLSASTGIVPPQIVGKLDPELERKERSTRKKKKPAAQAAQPGN
jgi:hypothetical protein